ncbi:unnamed protein product [Mytilus coruscus]|uniref:Glycosyltransferase 61 catalytic domain-containing protein n=1 Tax=Mytilus coruscus TaxID=42192 RepID=A0A6J8D700_MYTCO|nr:unnamed protein product [Mytilus coruscus]
MCQMKERCVAVMERNKSLFLGRKIIFCVTLSALIISIETFFHQSIGTNILKPDKISNYIIAQKKPNSVFLSLVESSSDLLYVYCEIEVKNAPFIWEKDIQSWFNITNHISISHKNHSLGTVKLDLENTQSLYKNRRKGYQVLGEIIERHDLNRLRRWNGLSEYGIYSGRKATFNDVIMFSNGWIIHKTKQLAVRNGGCLSENKLQMHNVTVTRYKRVVSIAVFWGEGAWHFPMEALVGLAYVTDTEQWSSFIHVTQKNKLVLQWLKLVGINEKRVIHGTILADYLIVPETGKCGSPSQDHIQWLYKKVNISVPFKRNTVLLIKRNKSRVMPHFAKIQRFVEKFAKEANINFLLHDDNFLPSLHDQLQRFANASIVIGPHGGGMVNLIAAPKGTCVIEFSPMEANVCYMRLSYLLGLTYVAVPLYGNNTVKENKIKEALNYCQGKTNSNF